MTAPAEAKRIISAGPNGAGKPAMQRPENT